MGSLPVLLHLGITLAGAPAWTWLAVRRSVRREGRPFEAAAADRRRILKTSAQAELFLVYSFLLLGNRYPTYAHLRDALGGFATAALFSAAVLLAYLIGAWTRASVDRRIRRIERSVWSFFRFHLLLLVLRMGVFVLVTPLFFAGIHDLDRPPWDTRNLLGFASVTLFFFLYVFRGPNVLLSALGMMHRFQDSSLEEEIQSEARKRKIPVRGIRVLRTWQSRFAGAFAHFGSSQIFITDHLPDVVDRDEMKAVLYHEVGHLGQWKASLIRVLGSYLVFLVFVYLKVVIDATAERRIGFEALIPGFLAFAVLALVIRQVFDRIIRDGEARADLFSAEMVGGRETYQQAIAKVLLANGLSMRFAPSAKDAVPSGAQIEDELW